jgi:hypothetical protein
VGSRLPRCAQARADRHLLHGGLLPRTCSHALYKFSPAHPHPRLQDFVKSPERAQRWHGLRQDSGDPFIFAPNARRVYESMGIDHSKKMIIFSDAVDVEKALKLKAQCEREGFICKFALGLPVFTL